MTLKVDMQHRVLEYYQVYSNDDPGLILSYFRARSSLVPFALVWEKGKTVDFSETVCLQNICFDGMYRIVCGNVTDSHLKLSNEICFCCSIFGWRHPLRNEETRSFIEAKTSYIWY